MQKLWYFLVLVPSCMVFGLGSHADVSAPMKKPSDKRGEADSYFTNSCDGYGNPAVPKPPLIAKYEAAIKAEMVKYYKAHSSYAQPIDLDRLCIQIEEFTWQNASYRLDASFSHFPGFLPYNSNYVQAHRMLMTKSGHMVISEPIYNQPNPEPGMPEGTVPSHRTGFFPGIKYFSSELNFVDQALRKARVVYRYEEGKPLAPSLSVDVSRGLDDLKDFRAHIAEHKDHYTITHDIQNTRYTLVPPYDRFTQQPPEFRPIHLYLIYDISKTDGSISNIRYRKYTPPALV